MKKCFLLLLILFSSASFSQSIEQQRKRFEELDSLIDKWKENKPAEAIVYSNEQIKIAESLKEDAMIYTATDQHSHLINSLGMFDESLKLLYKLLQRFDKKPDYKNIGVIQYNIGEVYFQMRDFKNCYDFFCRSKQSFIRLKRFNDTIRVNLEIGLALAGLGKHNEGIELIKQNIEAAKKLNNIDFVVNGIDDLANCYAELDDWENALKAELEIFNYPEAIESNEMKAAMNQHLAEMYVNLKQYSKAQQYVTEAIKYATDMGSNDWLFECYKNQSAIFEANKDYKNALLYHTKYLNTKDSVYKSNYDTKMSVMANLYELEHKQNEIKNLANENELASTKIQRLYLIIAALVLLIIIVFLFINHRKNRIEKILREKFSAQLIQTQENERQRISKELHDSVGQNILFIKNQIHKFLQDGNPALSKSVDSVLEEVRNISKDLYPNQLEQYGLLSAVDALCEKVKESTNVFISADLQLPDEKLLSRETKINCYRIIQECISNTLKHAAASAIRITSEFAEGKIQLIIQDNGRGFEQHILSAKAQHSFGMLNIQERVRILNGKFELETSPGNGTKSVFLIPVF
jgi:signal transduction histidine kinase